MGKIKTMRQGEVSELAKIFGVTTRTVNNALNERTKTEVTKRIRCAALRRGAVEAK